MCNNSLNGQNANHTIPILDMIFTRKLVSPLKILRHYIIVAFMFRMSLINIYQPPFNHGKNHSILKSRFKKS